LKKRGFDLIFTGGVLPASEVIEIHKIKSFDYLVVNTNSFDFTKNKISYFSSIGQSLMIKKIILTDSFEEISEKKFDKLVITKDPISFIRTIENLQ
jgi:hypothetical protein